MPPIGTQHPLARIASLVAFVLALAWAYGVLAGIGFVAPKCQPFPWQPAWGIAEGVTGAIGLGACAIVVVWLTRWADTGRRPDGLARIAVVAATLGLVWLPLNLAALGQLTTSCGD